MGNKIKIIAINVFIALVTLIILNVVVTVLIDTWRNDLNQIQAFKRIPQSFFWDFRYEAKKVVK